MAEPSKHNVDLVGATSCAVIVAHPDDETLWAGGTILINPDINWTIMTLCRKSDGDRAPKFFKVVEQYGAKGYMADLDDGPEQSPLKQTLIRQAVLETLPTYILDIIITHDRAGEYTRHLRHEEVSRAVMSLWKDKELRAGQLWTFAYEDGDKKYLPRAIQGADIIHKLPGEIFERKKRVITDIYGFAPDSFEAKAAPATEAFWRFGQN